MPRVIIGASEFGTGLELPHCGPWLFQLLEIDQGPGTRNSERFTGAPAAEGWGVENK